MLIVVAILYNIVVLINAHACYCNVCDLIIHHRAETNIKFLSGKASEYPNKSFHYIYTNIKYNWFSY